MQKFIRVSNFISLMVGVLSAAYVLIMGLASPYTILWFLGAFFYILAVERQQEKFFGRFSHREVTTTRWKETRETRYGEVTRNRSRTDSKNVYHLTKEEKEESDYSMMPYHLHIPTIMLLGGGCLWLFDKVIKIVIKPLASSFWEVPLAWVVSFLASAFISLLIMRCVEDLLKKYKFLQPFSVVINFPVYWLFGLAKGFAILCIPYHIYMYFIH